VQNAFAVLEKSDDDDDEDVATVITHMAALTTQSSVTTAIQQLNSNQQAMMQQMATYANANTTRNPPAVHNPPITHFNIPTIGTFQPGGNALGGRRPGRGHGGRAPVIIPGGCRAPHTPFADYLARQGGIGASIAPVFVPGVRGVSAAARNMAPMYSNIVKRYSNMNVCFSCGFNVENGHTSRTCPQAWRCANHQEAYNRSNAQQYINVGYNACTKAKHKTQLPAF
jgi:rubrerythrin